MEREIEIVNKIIREAIIHGADVGGSYESNEDNLILAVNEWLRLKGLSKEYRLEQDVDTGDGWHLHQIVKC